jgi:predicted nuclease of predicted toxin-antitoxin system
MRFLVDAQLPPALARQLTISGHQSTHVADAGLLSARDSDIWSHASAIGATLITKDEDFVTMRAFNAEGPSVVWVRLGNTTKRALLTHIASVFPTIIAGLERGETIIVVSER